MTKKEKNELCKKIRAMAVLCCIRGILKGGSDDSMKWAVEDIESDEKINVQFEFELVGNDIFLLSNLPEQKITEILKDAENLLSKHCKFWHSRWWEALD